LRDGLRGRPWLQQARVCAALVAAPGDPVEHRVTVRALRMTAQRVLAARAEAKELEVELRQLIMAVAPALLAQCGIGPVSAAQVLISCHTLAGSAPRPPSRCWAARHRWRPPPARSSAIGSTGAGTASCIEPCTPSWWSARPTMGRPGPTPAARIAQGKSERQLRRCRKRTVARQLDWLLERTAANQPPVDDN
jgi:transposase